MSFSINGLSIIILKAKKFARKYGGKLQSKDGDKSVFESSIIDLMVQYANKVKELEDYYQIDKKGNIKNFSNDSVPIALSDKKGRSMMNSKNMMMSNKMGSTMNSESKKVSFVGAGIMNIFGKPDGSVTTTDLDTAASMTQILKLTNSEACRSVTHPNSYLMKHALAYENLSNRVKYLYYSIFGRSPTKKEIMLATEYCESVENIKNWSRYTLALLNSPEFYFIK